MEQQLNQPKPLHPYIKQPYIDNIHHKSILLERYRTTLLYRKSTYLFSSFYKGEMIYIIEYINTNKFTCKQTFDSKVCKSFKEALKFFNQ